MNNINTKLTILLALALFISIAFMQWNAKRPDSTVNQSKIASNAYMIKLNYINYNTLGQIANHFVAPAMKHYTNNNTDFSLPNMLFYLNSSTKWKITALNGQAKNNKQLVLSGDVVLQQSEGADNSSLSTTTIRTSRLLIDQKQSMATTQSDVTIQQNGIEFQGKGAIIDLKKGTFTLLSKTQGEVQPQAISNQQQRKK